MATPGAVRVVEWNLLFFRRLWRSNLLNSFAQPMLYLLGLGIGVGSLVNRNAASQDLLGGISYARFVGPGLLCTAGMAIAYGESAWPVLGGFKWQRRYHAMGATSLTPFDLVLGHLLWLAVRVFIACAAVTAAMMLFPSVRDVWLIPSVVFATVSGMAFGMGTLAFAAYQTRDVAFVSINRFVVIPLFLFGGAFFPLRQLPGWVRAVIEVSPLWHGTELSRGLLRHTLGGVQATAHLAYLALWIVVGLVVASKQFARRLAS